MADTPDTPDRRHDERDPDRVGARSVEPSVATGRLYRQLARSVGSRPDHQGFLDVTMPHLDTVHSVALGLVRDPGRAEDLVQDTYLRAFAAFGGFQGGNARAWLVSICLNAGRSELRRARRRPTEEPGSAGPGDPDLVVAGADPAGDAIQRLAVLAALGELADAQRRSLVLCDMAGFTAQEAADLLGCPRGTILARVHRGRRRLAQLLEREGIRDEV